MNNFAKCILIVIPSQIVSSIIWLKGSLISYLCWLNVSWKCRLNVVKCKLKMQCNRGRLQDIWLSCSRNILLPLDMFWNQSQMCNFTVLLINTVLYLIMWFCQFHSSVHDRSFHFNSQVLFLTLVWFSLQLEVTCNWSAIENLPNLQVFFQNVHFRISLNRK